MQPSISDRTKVSPRFIVTGGGPTTTSIAIRTFNLYDAAPRRRSAAGVHWIFTISCRSRLLQSMSHSHPLILRRSFGREQRAKPLDKGRGGQNGLAQRG